MSKEPSLQLVTNSPHDDVTVSEIEEAQNVSLKPGLSQGEFSEKARVVQTAKELHYALGVLLNIQSALKGVASELAAAGQLIKDHGEDTPTKVH